MLRTEEKDDNTFVAHVGPNNSICTIYTYVFNQQIHTDKIRSIIHYDSPTHFGRFFYHHQGAVQGY